VNSLKLIGLIAGAVELALAALLIGDVLAAYFTVTAVATVAVTWVASRFAEPPPPPPDDPGEPDEPEPPWWPEFERELHAHVQSAQPV
jgi:hypothetical protein